MNNRAPAAGRLAALDTLRGAAILLVLGRHMPDWPATAAPQWLRPLAEAWRSAGWMGVDLFFVLSGFLVSGLLFREVQKHGTMRPGRFLVRRGFKIYPAYYALIGAWVAIMFVVKNVPAWQHVVSQILFVQNYWEILLPHTWSLAVEEHFYIVLPFLLCAMRGRDAARPFASMPWVCAAIVLGCLFLRCLTPWDGHIVWSTHVYPTHLRCDGLFLGVWLSWLYHFHGETLAAFVARWRMPLVFAGTILALPPFFIPIESTRWMNTFGFTMLSVSAACWLLLAVHREGRQGVLTWIGFYSYSIYLWHYVMSTLGMKYLSPSSAPPLVKLPIYIGGSILAGVLAAKIVEMPVLKLRDRLFPSRSQ